MAQSDSIQYLFREISVDTQALNNFPDETEDYYLRCHREDLKQELYEEVKALFRHFTPTQKKAVELFFLQGLSQLEIANKLSRCQPTIHKTLFGNIVYTDDGEKRYGGAIPKIRKLAQKNPRIKEILNELYNPPQTHEIPGDIIETLHSILTKPQYQAVYKVAIENKSQNQAAKELNKTQPAINRALFGQKQRNKPGAYHKIKAQSKYSPELKPIQEVLENYKNKYKKSRK